MTNNWVDAPNQQGYYWVVINNEKDYNLVYVDHRLTEFYKLRLAGQGDYLFTPGTYCSKPTKDILGKWLFIPFPNADDVNTIHSEFIVQSKKLERERIITKLEELNKELGEIS